MRNLISLALALLVSEVVIAPAQAALETGAVAPNFTIDASVGGNQFSFVLADALKKGPVVLYFYPKAFTSGCTVEAHQFSDAADSFAKLNATIIGISSDTLDVVKKFSVQECHSRFPVGADPDGSVIAQYDAQLLPLGHRSGRITYIITPDHKVFFVYKALNPDDHVKKALAALQQWKQKKAGN